MCSNEIEELSAEPLGTLKRKMTSILIVKLIQGNLRWKFFFLTGWVEIFCVTDGNGVVCSHLSHNIFLHQMTGSVCRGVDI